MILINKGKKVDLCNECWRHKKEKEMIEMDGGYYYKENKTEKVKTRFYLKILPDDFPRVAGYTIWMIIMGVIYYFLPYQDSPPFISFLFAYGTGGFYYILYDTFQ